MIYVNKCLKFCKQIKCKKVDYFKNDMFGKGITLKQVKDMKCKQLFRLKLQIPKNLRGSTTEPEQTENVY